MNKKIPAVNFHVWKYCNYECKFCFATFEDVAKQIKEPDALRVIDELAPLCDKITFVGGEPTLCPFLPSLVDRAHQLGLTTCVVSNGERLLPLFDRCASSLDWVGLSVDSADENVNQLLGRGTGDHVRRSIELADEAHRRDIRLKLNTVVTKLTFKEDMSLLVRRMRPHRWKAFQVLPVRGQNDGRVEQLLITSEEFRHFLERHESLRKEDLAPIPEDNDDMTGSYVMIDAMGRFFDNVDGKLFFSPSILDVGVASALEQVRWDRHRFLERGGLYPWVRPKKPQ